MKVRKIPLRMCAVTRERLPKMELVRVVRTPDGEVLVDLTGKMNGKGAYIKKDNDVLVKARKTKILEKLLECQIVESVYDKLEEIIKN